MMDCDTYLAELRRTRALAADHGGHRLFTEKSPTSDYRSLYQHDRDRIIHSKAFRRLKHKTQVFISHVGDHYRDRLTHSLEVAQIARALARALGLDEDLTEALALAHDLGHPPYGHAGEQALNRCMKDFGGFDHNLQTLRIVMKLERRYFDFNGLNLSSATIEGLAKHNGPLHGRDTAFHKVLAPWRAAHDLALSSHPYLEAQIAGLADDIAYNSHDIDDGLRGGFFSLDDLMELALTKPLCSDIMARSFQYTYGDKRRLFYACGRALIHKLVEATLEETCRRLQAHNLRCAQDIRACAVATAAFPANIHQGLDGDDTTQSSHTQEGQGLRKFLKQRLYDSVSVRKACEEGERVVEHLFSFFYHNNDKLPPLWQGLIYDQARQKKDKRVQKKARIVCDYIAGMTDSYAIKTHTKLRKDGLIHLA